MSSARVDTAGRIACARVMAIAGSSSQTPRVAPARTLLHLAHGEQEAVMPVELPVDAQACLQGLGAASTRDLFPGLGDGIDDRVVESIVRRLAAEPFVAPA